MPVVTCDDDDPREIEQRMEITSGRDVEVATRGGVPELVQPTFNRDAAGVYDDDVLAQMLHHIELMTGKQHGGACPRDLHQQLLHRVHREGIEPGERLIEDDQRRIVHQGRGQLDSLLIPVGQIVEASCCTIGQPQCIKPPVGRHSRPRGGKAGQPAKEQELVTHPHARIETALLRHVTEPAPDVGVDRPAIPPRLAAVGRHQPEDDPHRRRLASTVRPHEPGEAACRGPESALVECLYAAIPLGYAAKLEHADRLPTWTRCKCLMTRVRR